VIYVLAAYGLVALALAGYALQLGRERRSLRRSLEAAPRTDRG